MPDGSSLPDRSLAVDLRGGVRRRGGSLRAGLRDTALARVGAPSRRVTFEAMEPRILLSADVNPALASIALDLATQNEDVVSAVAQKLRETTPQVDLSSAVVPGDATPTIAPYDVSVVEPGERLAVGTQVQTHQYEATLDGSDTGATFDLDLQGGQTLSLIRTDGGSLQSTVTLRDPGGAVLATLAPGERLAQTVALTDTGTYSLEGARESGAGELRLVAVLNAAVEEEAVGGAANDTPADAQSLEPSALAFGTGAARLAGFGSGEDETPDTWSLDIADGDRVSLLLTTTDDGSARLAVVDADGNRLALGTSGDRGDPAISDLLVRPGMGDTLHVEVEAEGDYALVAMRNATYEAVTLSPPDLAYTGAGQGGVGEQPDLRQVLEGEAVEPDGTIFDANLVDFDPERDGIYTATGFIGDGLGGEEGGYYGEGGYGEGGYGENGYDELNPSDRDLFEVFLNQGDILTAATVADALGSGLDTVLTVFDDSGFVVVQNDDAGDSLDSAVEFQAGRAGTFYVGVSGFSNFGYDPFFLDSGRGDSTGDYELTIEVERFDGETGSFFAFEPDDTVDDAQLLGFDFDRDGVFEADGFIGDSFGDDFYGGIGVGGLVPEDEGGYGFAAPSSDRDIFEVYLDAGDALEVLLHPEFFFDEVEGIGSFFDGELILFDEDGFEVEFGTFDSDLSGDTQRLDFFNEDFGQFFYLGVSGEGNDSYDPFDATSGEDGSTGPYRVEVFIDRDATDFGGGYEEEFEALGDDAGMPLAPLDITETGDANNTLSEAQPIALPGLIEASERVTGDLVPYFVDSTSYDDRDIYAVELEAGDRLLATAVSLDQSDNVDTFLALYSSPGFRLSSDFSFRDNAAEIDFTAGSDGTYFVAVSNDRNSFFDPRNAASGGTSGESTPYALGVTVQRGEVPIGSSQFDLTLNAGDVVTIATETPNFGPELPGDTVDPILSLFAPDDDLVAVDADGAADGRNAELSFTVPEGEGGTYTVLLEAAGDTLGSVRVLVDGATGMPDTDPVLLSSTLSSIDGDILNTAPTIATLTFDRPLFLGSATASDLSINGVASSGVTVLSPTTLRFDLSGAFPVDGSFTVALADGAIESIEGGSSAAASWSFTLDRVAPTVVASLPGDGSTVLPGTRQISLTFSEDMRTGFMDVSDFTLTEEITGEIVAIESRQSDGARGILLNLNAALPEGNYRLDFDPTDFDLRDAAGNQLVATPITFAADLGAVDLDIRAVAPFGSFAHGGAHEGLINGAGDVETFDFVLGEAQPVAALLAAEAGAVLDLRLEDAGGTVLWSGQTDGGTGDNALLRDFGLVAAGAYRLVVAGTDGPGTYRLDVLLGARVEAEAVGGTANDTAADAEDLTPGLTALEGGFYSTVAGSFDGADADWHAVDLTAGQRLNVSVATGSEVVLEVFGPDGALVGLGQAGEDGTLAVLDVLAPADGTYQIRLAPVTDSTTTEGPDLYRLGIVVGAAMDFEPLSDAIRDISDESLLFGGLGQGVDLSGGRVGIIAGPDFRQTDSADKLTAQLLDSTRFEFDVSTISYDAIDTAGDLDAFDVVILGNDGFGQNHDGFGFYADILADWVMDGGAAIMTGWGIYGTGDETQATVDALNSILPTTASRGFGWGSSSSIVVIEPDHPVTEGLPDSFFTPGSIEHSRNGLNDGAVLLAGTSTAPTVAVREVGAGRSVYLGPVYFQPNIDLSEDEPDRLLEQAVAWAAGTDGEDSYWVTLAEGEEVTFETVTPGDGPDLPDNAIDLQLRLLGPDGQEVEVDRNSAADGRNARLVYTVPTGMGGSYLISVAREGAGAGVGHYVLKIDGTALEPNAAPVVVSSLPVDGSGVSDQPAFLDIVFSEGIAPETVDVGDLTLDGGATVTGATLIAGDTVRFDLSVPEVEGLFKWTLAADAVTDMQGAGNLGAAGSFTIDETPPWIVETRPAVQVSAPFSELTFVFDEPVDPNSVQVDDLTRFLDPNGFSRLGNVTGVTVDGAEVTFAFTDRVLEGQYQFTIGPDITDLVGNSMRDPATGDTSFDVSVDLQSPNLEVTDIVVPETARFGDVIEVTYTVTNTGSDPARSEGWVDRIEFYQSTTYRGGFVNAAVASEDDAGADIPPLAAGESYTNTVQLTLTEGFGLDEGDYRVSVFTDWFGQQAESVEGDNRSYSADIATTFPPLPDLVVSGIDAPTLAESGEVVEISWTLRNDGDADAVGTWRDSVSLVDADTGVVTFLRDYTFTGAIAQGTETTRVQSVDLPDTIDGNFFFRVQTDRYNELLESPGGGETNNTLTDTDELEIGLRDFPDLQVVSIDTPDLGFSGQQVTLEWEVVNAGDGPTNASFWTDRVYLSLDESISAAEDFYLGQARNPAFLAEGDRYTNTLTVTLPRGLEGPYFIGVVTDVFDQVLEFGGEDNNTGTEPLSIELTPPPDLQVTNVIAPAQAFSGQDMNLTWSVTNEGDGRTQESRWIDEVWMSTDAELGGGDISLGRFTHFGRLDPDESYSQSATLRLPIGLAGDYFFIVQTDRFNEVFEFVDEDNNTGVDLDGDTGEPSPTTVNLTPPPNLEATILSVGDVVLEDAFDPGDEVLVDVLSGRATTVTVLVENRGATVTPNFSWTDQMFLSVDSVLSPDDVLLDSRGQFGQLLPFQSYEATFNVALPDGALGDFHLIAWTDVGNPMLDDVDPAQTYSDGEVFEIARDDNIDAVAVLAEVVAPNLVLVSADVPEVWTAGSTVSVDWTVENRGEGDSEDTRWVDRVWLSVNDVFGDADDVALHSVGRSFETPLDAGAGYPRLDQIFAVPFALKGAYNVFIQTDADEVVFEADREADNVSAAFPVTILRDEPDLVVSDVAYATDDGATSIIAGRGLDVSWRVANEGVERTQTNAWYDRIYLSLDDAFDGTDILLGQRYRANALDPGEGYDATARVALPVTLTPGTYRVLVVTDAFATVIEAEEGNNAATSPDTLTTLPYDGGAAEGTSPFAALRPNLTTSEVTAPTDAVSGSRVDVTWTVVNDADADPTGQQTWFDGIWLSLDRQLDQGSDIFLGFEREARGLNPGESYTKTRTVTLPNGVGGQFYVLVSANYDGRMTETEALDNAALSAELMEIELAPPADLVVGAITVPETGLAGAPVSITYTVENAGDNAAQGSWTDRLYLSTDDVWDVDDALLGSRTVFGPVASGDSYTRTGSYAMPGVLPGDYFVLLRSDIQNQVEETDDGNNDGASDEQIAADAPELAVGGSESGIIGAGQFRFYKLTPAAGETIRITLDRANDDSISELYVARGEVPNRTSFDRAGNDPFQPDQTLLIPNAAADTYYIAVFAQSGAGGDYTVSAEVVPFGVDDVSADTIGNAGIVTLRIDGARFDGATAFELVDALGETVTGFEVLLTDSTRAYVSFDVTGLAAGLYDLRAISGEDVVEVADAVTVDPGLERGRMLVNISGAATVRPDRLNPFVVNYANAGGTDTRAPLILVTSSTGTPLGLSADGLGTGPVQILGTDNDGPVDLFRPGAESSQTVLFRSVTGTISINARAITETNTDLVEDWSEIEDQVRPSDLDDFEWGAFWARVQPRIGDTWGDYVGFLNNMAGLVSTPGDPIRDVRELFRAVFENENEWLPSVVFAGTLVDSQTDAPVAGVELRAYLQDGDATFLRGTVATDADGNFRFEGLEPGRYLLDVGGPRIVTNGVPDPSYIPYAFDIDRDGNAEVDPVFADLSGNTDVEGLVIPITVIEEEEPDPVDRAPVLATDTAGRLHMVFHRDGALVHSVNEGGAWSLPVAIPGSETASDVAFEIDANLIDGGSEGLFVAWTTGEGNEAEIVYVIGQRRADGSYEFTDPVALTDDAFADGEFAFGIGADGDATFLFTKEDAALEYDDGDIYTETVSADGVTFPVSINVEIGDEVLDLLEAYHAGDLSDAELEELVSITLPQISWDLGPKREFLGLDFQLAANVSGSVQVDNKNANATGTGGIAFTLGNADVNGQVGLQAGWFVNEETCEWEFEFGRLQGTVTGGLNFPIEFFTRPLALLTGPGVLVLEPFLNLIGASGRVEASVQGTASYANGGSWPFSPSSVSGAGRLSLGINVERSFDSFFLGAGSYLLRALVNANFSIASGWNISFADPPVSGTLSYQLNYDPPVGRPYNVSGAFTIPSGTGGLGLTTAGDIDLISLDSDVITGGGDDEDGVDAGFSEFIVTFLDVDSGSSADLSGAGESAVTNDTRAQGVPDMAETVEGELFGTWASGDGILVSGFDTASGTWGTPEVAVETGSFDVRDLTLAYDGDGDGVLAYNRIDISALETATTFEDIQSIYEDGGELAFAVYDQTGAQWMDTEILYDGTGLEHGLSMVRLDNGDIVATWMLTESDDIETKKLFGAVFDAASNTWSVPELIAEGPIGDMPSLASQGGVATVVWAETVPIEGSDIVDYDLRSASLGDTGWTTADVDVPTGVEDLDAEGSAGSDALLQPLWNVESLLPTPDGEDCEEEDEDDDDDEDDYDPDVVRPVDPNDIIGPEGFGEENWTSTQAPLDYMIRFENDPEFATAPAQVVVITHVLDDDLDFATFRFDDFGWGDLIFEVEEPSAFLFETYDFREELGFDVQVVGTLAVVDNPDDGTEDAVVTWTISTIDPETGEPPLAAEQGFLPVNDPEIGNGEGFVTYEVRPDRDAAGGTRIDATASIVFDTEAPIETPPIFNTLDVAAPSSMVLPLPARSETDTVTVEWEATDPEPGAGVASVTVYVSENGGDYTIWLEDSELTSAEFTGDLGSTYAFYSVARDNTGWLEEAPDTPDATVALGPQPGRIAGLVFEDVDGDGVQGAGEAGVLNAFVYLDLNGSGAFDEGDVGELTDASGAYLFDDLQPGSFDVGVVLPTGFDVTTPDGAIITAAVAEDATTDAAPFGLFRLGAVAGIVYGDGTGPTDGIRDGAEQGLAGWTVYLDADGDGGLDEDETRATTDAVGRYALTGLGAGTATIRLVLQDGFDAGTPADPVLSQAILSGTSAEGLNFGVLPKPGTVAGTLFEDLDGNGIVDAGEPTLSGWEVYLDANGDGTPEATAVTDGAGAYLFEDVAPGDYIVTVEARPGFVQTFPDGGAGTAAATSGMVLTTTGAEAALVSPSITPSTSADAGLDPLSLQGAGWADALTGLDDLRDDARFADVTGSRSSVVVIDTGIDVDHGFFGPDADGDGVADRIVYQYDFADDDADASDRSGHGSSVAGIIAGQDDRHGGLAPGADVIALKVFGDDGAGTFGDLERALQWVVANADDFGVGVVNLSLGDGGNWQTAIGRYGLGDELAALADLGIILVAASGNSYGSFDTQGVAYPAADPAVLGVGAVWAGDYGGPWYFSNGATDYTTGGDRIAAFTQRDDALLDALAPGARFVTANASGGLSTVQGTSHAAAYMSGVATLAQDIALRAHGVTLSAAEFSAILSQTAVTVLDGDDEDDSVSNSQLAFPRLDVMAMAEAILAYTPQGDRTGPGDPGGAGPDDEDPLVAVAGARLVTVLPDQDTTDINFAVFEQVGISGVVFGDGDGNGLADPGEGLAGVTVFTDLDDDGVLDAGEASVVTGADGGYALAGQGPGDVVVRIALPAGFTGTDRLVVPTVSGTDVMDADFALTAVVEPPVTISGVVFDDANADGISDAGEGLSGVTVFADLDDDGVLDAGEASVLTGADGGYALAGQGPGDVVVRIALPSGFTGTDRLVVPTVSGTDVMDADFALTAVVEPPVTISGVVFDDANADGISDAGEGLAGVTVFADLDDDGVLDAGETSVLTRANGSYALAWQGPGDVVVRIALPSGFTGADRLVVPTVSGTDVTGADFALAAVVEPPVTISGVVFGDGDGDGIADPGEGLAGVTVFADLDDDGVLDAGEASVVTGADGGYALAGQGPGDVVVRIALPAGFTGTDRLVVPTVSGTDVSDADFALSAVVLPPVTIFGFVFADGDADGVADPGEGLEGVTVFADLDDDGVLDAGETSVLTRANGSYALAGQGPGDVVVRIALPAGFTGTDRIVVPTVSGADVTGADFALVEDAVGPQTLTVTSVTQSESGFALRFNAPIDLGQLEVGGPTPDILLTDGTGALVRGSIVIDADARGFTFLRTGGPLAGGAYTLTLRSAADGVASTALGALDGDADGVAGGDFATSFSVAAAGPTLSVGDLVRAPGQALGAPGGAPGLAVTLTGGAGVSQLDFRLAVDPALLDVTGFQLGADVPAGSIVQVTGAGSGEVSVRITFAAPVATDDLVVGHFIGAVPASAPAGASQVLDLSIDSVAGLSDLAADDGMHAVRLPGDVDGDGSYGVPDLQAMSKLLFDKDSGLETGQTVDLGLIGDVDGDGEVTSRDSLLLFRASLGIFQPGMPALPTPSAADAPTVDLSTRSGDYTLDAGSGSSVNAETTGDDDDDPLIPTGLGGANGEIRIARPE